MNMQLDAGDGLEQSQSGAAPNPGREGNCLLLTSAALRMLVPRTLVAEVLGPSFLEFTKDAATGLEFFGWRGRRVPLLDGSVIGAIANRCQSQIDSETDSKGDNDLKVAILHGLKQPQQLPYYGVFITRSPRLLRVSDGDLEEVAGAQLLPAELMRIRVEGGEACIPKVDHFESSLIDLIKSPAPR